MVIHSRGLQIITRNTSGRRQVTTSRLASVHVDTHNSLLHFKSHLLIHCRKITSQPLPCSAGLSSDEMSFQIWRQPVSTRPICPCPAVTYSSPHLTISAPRKRTLEDGSLCTNPELQSRSIASEHISNILPNHTANPSKLLEFTLTKKSKRLHVTLAKNSSISDLTHADFHSHTIPSGIHPKRALVLKIS